MSEETQEAPEKPATEKTVAAEKPAAKAGASPPFMLIGVAVGALAVGAALGGLVVGPKLSAGRTAKPAAHATAHDADREAEPAEEEPAGDSHGKKKGHGEKRAPVFRLDNLIVNPAGSQGTRFLMAAVAFEVGDEKAEARLREREVQLRDVVMSTLESHSLEMLTAPGSRDSLKQRLASAVAPVIGKTRVKVFLPQFVIQ